jgi:hypothetical protein
MRAGLKWFLPARAGQRANNKIKEERCENRAFRASGPGLVFDLVRIP